ncbi:hypothetical protein LTR08_003898 [Meristemomyces frigidus]|nr:hypothetical protein LTR08_003898 [Meristemomyces frigidus]
MANRRRDSPLAVTPPDVATDRYAPLTTESLNYSNHLQNQQHHANELRASIAHYVAAQSMSAPMNGHKTIAKHASGPAPLWLDVDTGHDDAFAILLAARSPDVRLLGLSTVYGNAPLPQTTYNTRAILEAIGRTDVPVYAGASKPHSREACHAPEIHGKSGLDGTACLPKPTVKESDLDAVRAMHRALSAQPKGTAWLVATGALTNIAALFAQHPTIVDHIAGLSIMGGAVGNHFTGAPMGKLKGEGERFGNHTPMAEFNIWCDPESAQAIFSNAELAKKTTLIPLDLTHQFLATSEVRIGLLGFGSGAGSEPTMASVSSVRRLFFEIVTFFARTYADVFGITAGPPTHDPLAVAVAFRPDLFYCNAEGTAEHSGQHERFTVEVVTKGEHGMNVSSDTSSQCGRTIVTPLPPGEEGITIPRGLEARTLWSLLEACLNRTEMSMHRATAVSRKQSNSSKVIHANAEQNHADLPSLYPSADPENGGEDMSTLVPNANTTLSQFEQSAGTFPDIKGPVSDKGGEFLTTNKIAALGITPMDM